MSEKRFTFEVKIRGNTAYIQWYDGGKPINSAETIVELLNELHEENYSLKKQNKRLHNDLHEINQIARGY